jgi:hypothetical protein
LGFLGEMVGFRACEALLGDGACGTETDCGMATAKWEREEGEGNVGGWTTTDDAGAGTTETDTVGMSPLDWAVEFKLFVADCELDGAIRPLRDRLCE